MSSRSSRAVLESFGLTVEVLSEDPQITDSLHGVLPLWRRSDNGACASASFHVTREGKILLAGRLVKQSNGEPVPTLFAVGSAVQEYLALCAPEHIFIHAGVVAIDEAAVVMPGRTFTGKTTLVSELVRAGARYYSDEFAVVDRDGLIHAYPRMLTLRIDPRTGRSRVPVLMPGKEYNPEPVPAGMLLVTSYRPGDQWQPLPLTVAEGVLALFDNTVPAQSRPLEALRAARQVANGAVRLSGTRGEAPQLAAQLLKLVNGNR
jgi:hypothetical protein